MNLQKDRPVHRVNTQSTQRHTRLVTTENRFKSTSGGRQSAVPVDEEKSGVRLFIHHPFNLKLPALLDVSDIREDVMRGRGSGGDRAESDVTGVGGLTGGK